MIDTEAHPNLKRLITDAWRPDFDELPTDRDPMMQKIKRTLCSAFYADILISETVEEISKLRSVTNKVTTSYSITPMGGGGDGQGKAEASNKIVDLEKDLESYIALLAENIRKVHRLIDLVKDPKLRIILSERYLLFNSFSRIGVRTAYSRRRVSALHKEALNEILKAYTDPTIDHDDLPSLD